MSAMETMVANMLKAMGVDPEAIKKEVSTRVEQFEKNVNELNAALRLMNAKLENIETHMGLTPIIKESLPAITDEDSNAKAAE